jgi:enolase
MMLLLCVLRQLQDACNVGDEGGFAPNIQSNIEGIELLMKVSLALLLS